MHLWQCISAEQSLRERVAIARLSDVKCLNAGDRRAVTSEAVLAPSFAITLLFSNPPVNAVLRLIPNFGYPFH
jgi:hypothetical protein